METDFEVRQAGRADLPCLVRMAVDFRRHLGEKMSSEAEYGERIEFLLDDPETDFLVALDGTGRCSGFLQQRYRRSIWSDGGDAYLEDLFVVDGSRRQGLGGRLVEMAVDRARTRGCVRLTLNTMEPNLDARALYARFGFRSGNVSASEVAGNHELWLEKPL